MKARITILLACCLLTCHVRTFAVNVDVEFVDASSASGDKYVSRNVDDDDKNEQWDKDQNEGQMLTEQPAEPENDLKKFKVTTSIENGPLSISVDTSNIPVGTSYTDNVRFWADEHKKKLHKKEWTVTGGKIIDAQDAPADKDGTEGYFWVEGLVNSASLNDIEIKAKIGDEEDPLKINVIEVDLDVDSDNANDFNKTGFTDEEDKIETSDQDEHPGKIVIFSKSANSDGDQVPDFADGFNLDLKGASGPSGLASVGSSLKFVPVRIELKTPLDPATAKVKFPYQETINGVVRDFYKVSRPELAPDGDITLSGNGVGIPFVFKVEAGGMRLWNKNATERTSGKKVADGGNFIPADAEIEWYKIEESSGSRTGWVYLEYVDKEIPEYAGTRQIKVTAKDGTLETSDTVNVYLPPVELDVNGDGDLDDPCDGLASYLPGYELSTAKLHTGTSFENSQYAGPQSMNIIIDNLPFSIADEAHIRIVAASNWSGYCGNGSIANESPILPYNDFSLEGQETVSSNQEATVTSTGNKMVIPIYCHDYGGWCEVEITLKKNGSTIGSPIKLTLPQDGNGDRLPEHWQDTEITAWNNQFGDTRPINDVERSKMKPGSGYDLADYADDEMKKSDGASGSMPAMADEGDVLKVMEEYRGFMLDAGPGITSTGHRRLSIAKKEALFQFLVMPQITDGSNPGNCANTAAQGFDAAQRFQAVHAFYKSKYPNGGADLDCYMVKLPLIPNASQVTYLDGTTRPAYLLDTKLNPIAGHTRPANALTYVYYDQRLFDEDAQEHLRLYSPDLDTARWHALSKARSAAETLKGPRSLDRFTVCAFYNRFGKYSRASNWNLGVIERDPSSSSNHIQGGTLTSPMYDSIPWGRGCQFAVNAISEDPSANFSNGQMDYAIAHEIGHTMIWARDAGHPGAYPGLMAELPSGTVITSLSQVQLHSDVISLVDLRNRASVVK